MKHGFKLALVALALCLSACNDPKTIPLGNTPIDNPKAVALVREGSMFLRGFDKKRMELKEMPNPMGNFLFALTPGTHSLLAMNIQSGHLVPLENMRCYIIEAELKAGVIYRLNEDKKKNRAVLVREDSGAEVASSPMVDKQSALFGMCNWK